MIVKPTYRLIASVVMKISMMIVDMSLHSDGDSFYIFTSLHPRFLIFILFFYMCSPTFIISDTLIEE